MKVKYKGVKQGKKRFRFTISVSERELNALSHYTTGSEQSELRSARHIKLRLVTKIGRLAKQILDWRKRRSDERTSHSSGL